MQKVRKAHLVECVLHPNPVWCLFLLFLILPLDSTWQNIRQDLANEFNPVPLQCLLQPG